LRGGVLFAADALITGETFKPPPVFLNEDTAQARTSIKRLREYDFQTAVSGHGRPAGDAQAKVAALATSL
jgi:glyoxylase-like metal-dependent hydrolase (beta-lactamase superfamily II)